MAESSTLPGVSSSVVRLAPATTGASLLPTICSVTVALSWPPLPSFTCTTNERVPKSFGAGAYEQAPAVVQLSVPCVGGTATVYVSGSPLASVADRLNSRVVSSITNVVESSMTGGALSNADTLTLTCEVAVPPLPSLTTTSKLSRPAKPVAGVYVHVLSTHATVPPFAVGDVGV